MTYDELCTRLLSLPGATDEWLNYSLSYSDDGRPTATSYCLLRRDEKHWVVYQGDERGGTRSATADGETPLSFDSEAAACEWICQEIMWWRDFEARRRTQGMDSLDIHKLGSQKLTVADTRTSPKN